MRILVIEDEKAIAGFLVEGLREEGFEVEWAATYRQAQDLRAQWLPQLILLDWMLPDGSGLQWCQELRMVDKATPVIFLTARDTVDDTIQGLQAGAQDYIRKPFHFSELLERIRVQLRDEAPSATTQGTPASILPEVYNLGDLVLRPRAREVSMGGYSAELTPREYDLLLYLVQHRDEVCTRQAIIRDVWDIHFEYDSSIIDVYINALRRKLGLRGNHNYIHTLRGIGYKASAS